MLQFNPPFFEARLVRRYKRFLADIETTNGDLVTIHCPNTGSMKNCLAPGAPLWYSQSANPKRKYPFTWEIATTPAGHLAGVNTARANPLVAEALAAGMIAKIPIPDRIQPEVRYGEHNSRADFCLWHADRPLFVEVKNVTLLEGEQGYFPDAVSIRAQKHLAELSSVVRNGGEAALIFCVQHSAIDSVAPAKHIDAAYAQGLRRAARAGVQVFALKAKLSADEILLNEVIPVLIA